jgi:hypothetical protein
MTFWKRPNDVQNRLPGSVRAWGQDGYLGEKKLFCILIMFGGLHNCIHLLQFIELHEGNLAVG